ncbi:hypothetical protein K504DRAFT_116440 [Pleomassaria siparia CBS 279.74]|uniref:Uncharacterized protein n=1 Tax=Pleomassaria siparia CBS 279.74 TaxID=1314801 RepID=A0A6G1JVD2_9PLEO|nr:hypothetical protein K504DRAFT_116440 [Pleomassaria siparia CBS 279.74]
MEKTAGYLHHWAGSQEKFSLRYPPLLSLVIIFATATATVFVCLGWSQTDVCFFCLGFWEWSGSVS